MARKMAPHKRPNRKPKGRERGGRPIPSIPSQDVAALTFYDVMPRAELTEALELSKDARFETLARLMLDPARQTQSFPSKMVEAGVALPDLYDFWGKHQMHVGLLKLANRVPKIIDDVGQDAESRMTACNRCDGLGEVIDMIPGSDQEPTKRTCPVCEGARKMRVIGDKASRDLVFESMGLTGKRPPPVLIQQNFGLESELGDVLMASQKVITGGGSND